MTEPERDDSLQPPSKTRRKKEMHALQSLGEALVDLSPGRLESLGLPEPLHEAVVEARRIKSHEARRRQMQYIGRLMREVDPAPIQARLDAWSGQSAAHTAAHHRVERWRERLLEDEAALTAFAAAYPRADLQALRALLRETKKERELGRSPRRYRELFRFLRDAAGADTAAVDPSL